MRRNIAARLDLATFDGRLQFGRCRRAIGQELLVREAILAVALRKDANAHALFIGRHGQYHRIR